MTDAQTLIATVAVFLIAAVAAAIIDRWAHRRRLLRRLDTGNDDQHQIDIVKRGEICPWPVRD